MKKLYLLSLLMMLSIVAMAQTVIVVDKDGNRVPYDPSKVTTVEFQTTPPGFTVNQEKGSDKYLFDKVSSLRGNPNSLFIDPGTVNAKGDGESLAVQVKASTEFDVTTSASWITFDDEAKDGQRYVKVAMNPSLEERTGTVVFTSKDGALVSTLKVVQAGKDDARCIDIDWEKATLDSYDPETGVAVIIFKEDVPIMGEYDVVLLPQEFSTLIRVIDSVAQTDGSKTVSLTTSEGDITNLFKNTEFTLDFDIAEEEGEASTRAKAAANVYRPVKIEDYDGEKFVEVYNGQTARSRAKKAPNDMFNFRYNATGESLYKSSSTDLKWRKHMLMFGLRGSCSYNFGQNDNGVVKFGETKGATFMIEGDTYSQMEMECSHNKINVDVTDGTKTTLMKENAIMRKYTFLVGEKKIPLVLSVKVNIMSDYQLKAGGKVDMSVGISTQSKIKYGVEYKTEGVYGGKMETKEYWTHQCKSTQGDMVDPVVKIDNNDTGVTPFMNVTLSTYPQIVMWVYDNETNFTVSPKATLTMNSYDRYVNGFEAMSFNACPENWVHMVMDKIPGCKKSTWLEFLKGNDYESVNYTRSTNQLMDGEEIARFPAQINNINDYGSRVVFLGDEREAIFNVKSRYWPEGGQSSLLVSQEIVPAAKALVKLEAKGGEFVDAKNPNGYEVKQTAYQYADEEGNVSIKFKPTSEDWPNVKATIVSGDPAEEIKTAWAEMLVQRFDIQCLTPEQEIEKGASAEIIYEVKHWENTQLRIDRGDEMPDVEFKATGGTVSPQKLTDEQVAAAKGKLTVTFTPDENATEGNVLAVANYIFRGNVGWEGKANGKVTVKSESTVDDEQLKKAEKLKENTYEIKNKKTGETEIRDYKTQWSEWTKDQDAVSFQLEDADDDGGTKGMVYGFIPKNMVNLVLKIAKETFVNTPGAKFGFEKFEGGQVMGNFMSTTDHTEGNIKPESRMILRPVKSVSPAPRRAPGDDDDYTGEYELLYYLVFNNETWNSETQQMEEGDEYEVYGRGTMTMHVPTITSFVLSTDKDWVKVGESTKVSLENYYEEGATWDWNDLQIVGQSSNQSEARNGTDNGFFSWDPATQTLTSLKSNDNKNVWVYLGLKSKPSVKAPIQVATGEGWKYTMIKPSVDEFTYTGYGYLSFSFDFAPKESEDEKIDFNALEIDPATNPNGYFSIQRGYGPQGWPIYVNNAPAGEYTVRIWVKSNHDVNCTIKVISTLEE